MHVRSVGAMRDRPRRVAAQFRAASWDGGFPAKRPLVAPALLEPAAVEASGTDRPCHACLGTYRGRGATATASTAGSASRGTPSLWAATQGARPCAYKARSPRKAGPDHGRGGGRRREHLPPAPGAGIRHNLDQHEITAADHPRRVADGRRRREAKLVAADFRNFQRRFPSRSWGSADDPVGTHLVGEEGCVQWPLQRRSCSPVMNLDLRETEVFRRLMELGSVTAAAAAMHVSQPAVTRMLQKAEQRLGFELFVRERRRLRPTAEAQLIFPEGLGTFAAIHARRAARRSGSGVADHRQPLLQRHRACLDHRHGAHRSAEPLYDAARHREGLRAGHRSRRSG